ncbi:MAG: ATP-binding protein, partial [Spirochaetaceae bacterium]|nr:ATP-binding protein [Spirochaetaceae bacterium]
MTSDEAYCGSIGAGLAGLAVFSGLREHPLVAAFLGLLAPVPAVPAAAWARFTKVFADYADDAPFCRVFYEIARADVNRFTLAAERGCLDEDGFVAKIAANDLAALARAAAFDFSRLAGFYDGIFYPSDAANSETDFGLARIRAEERLFSADSLSAPPAGDAEWTAASVAAFVRENGAGDFSRHSLFYVEEGKLKPAGNGDTVRLRDLSGYDEERGMVVSNTLRFLSGGGKEAASNLTKANNVLLYGDRGCGKSATVKAVCNEFSGRGLRLVEIKKEELASLPAVMRLLAGRGLRFILFIDDLSFEAGDSGFMALKATLEGGVEATPSNVAIYATSNRRHLVKEPRADRQDSSGDIRAFDTMQEQLSLADRFGLTVIFSAPQQEEYLRI